MHHTRIEQKSFHAYYQKSSKQDTEIERIGIIDLRLMIIEKTRDHESPKESKKESGITKTQYSSRQVIRDIFLIASIIAAIIRVFLLFDLN
jgi:hypothetical protein